MQISRAKTRTGSSEGPPQRTSPATPRSSRVSRSADCDSNSVSSATPTKTSTDKSSPKVIERRSPRSPATEKKRPSRVSELEKQISQLQEELKKSKDQLDASEAWKKQAQQEAEETEKQFKELSEKLDDSQRQLVDFSAAEEARLQELRKISQERDRAWQSELEAIEKQHSVDSAALSSATNEIQKLKSQLEMVLESEAANLKQSEAACAELQALRQDMSDAIATIENLKIELLDCQGSESEVHAEFAEVWERLEMAKRTIETLNMEGLELRESLSSKLSELEESKARVSALEEGFKILNASKLAEESEIKEIDKVSSLEMKVKQLRSALEAAETRYQEERVQCTMKIQADHQSIEHRKSDSVGKESELELALNDAKSEILQLKANLVVKEAELRRFADMDQQKSADIELAGGNQMQAEQQAELLKLNVHVAELKANLMDKETELQNVLEENESLKSELGKKEMETRKSSDEAIAELELAKAAEQDALLRLGHVSEEADKSSRRAARAAEKLEAAQAVNLEMESELKRLRIQSDQWRKAAEAAAAVLTSGNNNTGGRLMERTGSLDSDFNSVARRMLSSPFSDDLDDDSPKKKNNMLRKIGGLWKKSPK